MRLGSRTLFFQDSLQWAIAEVVVVAACLGGLWCLIAILTSLREKARRGNDRW